MTRSWVHLAHGRIGEAVVQSPLGVVLFGGLVLSLGYLAARSLGWAPALRLRLSRAETWGVLGLGAVTATANWLYLELTGVAL